MAPGPSLLVLATDKEHEVKPTRILTAVSIAAALSACTAAAPPPDPRVAELEAERDNLSSELAASIRTGHDCRDALEVYSDNALVLGEILADVWDGKFNSIGSRLETQTDAIDAIGDTFDRCVEGTD